MEFPLLSLYVFAPVLGMAAVLCIPSKYSDIVKTTAAAFAAIPLLIGIYLFFAFRDNGGIPQFQRQLWGGSPTPRLQTGRGGVVGASVGFCGVGGLYICL